VSESGVTSGKYRFEPGDVLYSKIRPYLNKVALVDFEGLCSADMYAVTVNPQKMRSDYLVHLLRSPSFLSYTARLSNRANIPKLNREQLARFQFNLPSLDEQQRIAALLDQADGLRAMRRRVVSCLDSLANSIFSEMFGKFAGRFGTVEEAAAPQKGSIRTGPFGSQLLHSEFVDEGIAVLGLDNVVGNAFTWGERRRYITPEKYGTLHRYTVHPGDVLVSIMGTCGRCVVVPDDVGAAINTKHICAITLDSKTALPEFVRAAFLWHPRSRAHLTQRTKGSIMDGLNMGIVQAMPLPLPDLDDQREFVARSMQLGGLLHSCLHASSQVDDLFISLQSRAFSGQL
jgi:type I restriction enzyme S subunit